MELGIFIIIFFLCVAVGLYADRLNRSGLAWGIVSFFLSPLIGWVLLLAIGEKKNEST
jgi:Na+/proline symporter